MPFFLFQTKYLCLVAGSLSFQHQAESFEVFFYIKNDFQESVIEKLQCVLCRTHFNLEESSIYSAEFKWKWQILLGSK
jgi:hypothetical protein